jgi:hypothetical protein
MVSCTLVFCFCLRFNLLDMHFLNFFFPKSENRLRYSLRHFVSAWWCRRQRFDKLDISKRSVTVLRQFNASTVRVHSKRHLPADIMRTMLLSLLTAIVRGGAASVRLVGTDRCERLLFGQFLSFALTCLNVDVQMHCWVHFLVSPMWNAFAQCGMSHL